ncbi:MAG: RNA polymerase sigma factor [Opitutales bacterium]|nr:RNA polymerase sigma factor [Opitutales bacterium]
MNDPEKTQSQWFLDEVLPHEGDLRAWLRSRFSSLNDLDDIIQDAYERMMKAHTSGPIVNPRAFLFVVTRNLALNRIRESKIEDGKIVEFDPLNVVDDSVIPSEKAAKSEEVQILVKAIQSLPTRCRQIITLRKIYGLSQKEVAKTLNISVSTVEAQGSIGLRKCMQHFRQLGYQTRKKK